MASGQPYLYQRPSTTSFTAPSDRGFNPRAVTEATWTPREPRPHQNAPYITAREMNRQSESYFIVGDRGPDFTPMSKSTKIKVKWMRIVLLNVRVCTLLGALGLLFCIICIKPTGVSVDWIIRVAPGVALLHSVYGVFHLARWSKKRTPASSASYMTFAAIMDAGVLPFLAFTAYMAYEQMLLGSNNKSRWQTLFPAEFQTSTIIYATWLVSLTSGGAHTLAFALSVYMAVVFRRIAKLPPDMNPLEDNLTARPRHKRNKSSVSMMAVDIANSSVNSTSDQPLMEKSRNHPLAETRSGMQSMDSLPPSPLRRSGPPSARDSALSFHAIPYQPSPAPPLHRSSPGAGKRVSAPPLGMGPYARAGPTGNPPRPRPHSLHPTATSQVIPVRDEDEETWLVQSSPPSPTNHAGRAPPELQHLRRGPGGRARGSTPDVTLSPPRLQPTQPTKFQVENRSPKPLGMNPPTPVGAATTTADPTGAVSEYVRNPYRSPTREQRQALRDLAHNAAAGGDGSPMTWEEVNLRPSKERLVDPVHVHHPHAKGRFYGSLRGMISGGGRRSGGVDELGRMDEDEVSGMAKGKKGRRSMSGKKGGQKGTRTVSSGVDDNGSKGGLRAREVSGKVAEEGRSTTMH